MTLRSVPRPKDRTNYSWVLHNCEVCWTHKLLPLELVDRFGMPGCPHCDAPEARGH